jgi:rod shape-determining protein MreD
MRLLIHVGIWLAGVWLQASVAPAAALWGYRPNLLLLTLLVLVLRWPSPWLFVYGALAGLAMDSFTHGVLGIYGLSFFATAIAARIAAGFVYDNSTGSALLVVLAMAWFEGTVAITIFEVMDPATPWWRWWFTRVIPPAFYTALCCPPLLWAHGWLERRLRWGQASWEFRA